MPTKNNSEALITLSHAIGDDLALLSALQATELEAQTLKELKNLGFPGGLGLNLRSEKADSILNHLHSIVKNWPDEPDSACLDDLAADFAAIYLNGQFGASPHESYWLDEDHLVMQKPMFEVRELYQAHGMEVENWRSRADDHIVIELNFLAEIIKAGKQQDNLNVAATFLDEHLLRWVDQFAGRVASHSESDFYIGLTLLTAVYCDELRDLLAEILGEPRPDPAEIETKMREKQKESIKVAPPQFGPESGPTF